MQVDDGPNLTMESINSALSGETLARTTTWHSQIANWHRQIAPNTPNDETRRGRQYFEYSDKSARYSLPRSRCGEWTIVARESLEAWARRRTAEAHLYWGI